MRLRAMGAAAWVIIGVVVLLGIGAHRARRKEAGRPVAQSTGQSALGLYCVALGLDYVGRTDNPWPYVVLLAAPVFVATEVLAAVHAKRRPELVAQPGRSAMVRAVGLGFIGFGGFCMVLAAVGLAAEGENAGRCAPGRVCDAEVLLIFGVLGVALLLIGSVIGAVARPRGTHVS